MRTIKEIQFSEILPVWSHQLWPGRESKVEPVSVIDLDASYNMDLLSSRPYFWGCFQDLQLVGVVSGFKTSETHFRSRGIWVHDNYRRQGIGTFLMKKVEEAAVSASCQYLWSMPRVTAWKFYEENGFRILLETNKYEFGPHYLAEKKLF